MNVIISQDEDKKVIPLPDFGEVKIICHEGKIKLIETTTKEKMN